MAGLCDFVVEWLFGTRRVVRERGEAAAIAELYAGPEGVNPLAARLLWWEGIEAGEVEHERLRLWRMRSSQRFAGAPRAA